MCVYFVKEIPVCLFPEIDINNVYCLPYSAYVPLDNLCYKRNLLPALYPRLRHLLDFDLYPQEHCAGASCGAETVLPLLYFESTHGLGRVRVVQLYFFCSLTLIIVF